MIMFIIEKQFYQNTSVSLRASIRVQSQRFPTS